MTLEMLEQYLDGALDAPQAKAVEAAIAADEVLAARIERLKTQRALRAAAMSTYAPTTDESRMLAMTAIDAMYEQSAQPVGRVGFAWVKRFGAVAAALVIAAISFYAGQKTATPTTIAGGGETQDRRVVVIYKDARGNVLEEKMFEQQQEAEEWIASKTLEAQDERPAIDDSTLAGGVM